MSSKNNIFLKKLKWMKKSYNITRMEVLGFAQNAKVRVRIVNITP